LLLTSIAGFVSGWGLGCAPEKLGEGYVGLLLLQKQELKYLKRHNQGPLQSEAELKGSFPKAYSSFQTDEMDRSPGK